MPTPSGRIDILAIDGGGIRGIIPATILAKMEEKLGHPMWETFDLIAGTSTGGIIAAAIGAGAKKGDAYTSAELVDLYVEQGPTIFHRGFLTEAEQVFGPKYSPEPLEAVLRNFFGDSELKSAKTPLLISSYDVQGNRTFFFKSEKAKAQDGAAFNWKLREIARATSAAPTYFPPTQLRNEFHTYTLVDGGVCVNNPAMAAYAEARRIYPDAKDFLVVSVGTGDRPTELKYEDVRQWGLLGWAKHIAPLFMDSGSDTADYELHYIVGNDWNFRFQPGLDKASSAMDCVTPDNLQALRDDAEGYLADADIAVKFETVCALLSQRWSAQAVGTGS